MSESLPPADQQLIELLEHKSPEELSFEELELLRARLGESPLLRVALAKHLQTESYLTQVLGNFTISPEVVIARAEAHHAAQARPWQWLIGGVVCIGLGAVLVAVFLNAMKAPEDPRLAVVIDKQTTTPVEDKKTTEVTPAPDNVPPAPPENPPDKPVDPIAAPTTPAPDAPNFAVSIAAEKFAKGNVKVDNSVFGNAANTIIHAGNAKSTNVAYDVDIPKAGEYFVHLHYASAEPRPLQATLNGKKFPKPVAGENTGGFHFPNQKWFTEGKHAFKRGKNQLRFERAGLFPHLHRIVISSVPTISDETAPPVPAAELVTVEPWQEALDTPNPPTYLATAFDDFDTAKSLPQVQDVLRWFATVPDQQKNVGDTQTKLGKCAELNGVFRLRWPWQENAALRLSLENHNRLRLHFYTGTTGVTLVYYQEEGFSWAAYATTRKDDKTHVPETLALTATDEGRCARTEMRFGGPIDLRWHAGELILSRGDVVLLQAPLAERPQQVFFDGRCAFHGLAIVPSKDSPPGEVAPAAPPVTSPASLTWFEQLTEGAKVVKHPDGAVELIGDNAKGSGFISAPLSCATPSEITLELEGVSRGSGVFLSPEKPPGLLAVRFATNTRMNPPVLCASLRQDELREGDLGLWQERVSTLIRREKTYVRFLTGAGIVRHAISADGVHWAHWEDPLVVSPAGSTSLCLHYVSAEPNCRIKLNKITVRPLPALAQQAGEGNLIAKVPVLNNTKAPTLSQWLADVATSQPPDVSASAWRRTAALRALAAGCDADLGTKLVQLILDDAESRHLPLDQLLAVYREAFRLIDTRQNAAQAQGAIARYFTAQNNAAPAGAHAFSTVRHAAMTTPVSWRHNLPVYDDQSIRLELIRLLYTGKWDDVAEFCQTLRFYQQHQRVPLVEWAEVTAARQSPGRAGGETSVARLKASWRPLLVEELSKDAYNLLAEMQAILDSDAYDDAARMITSISPDAVAGVAPHGRDRQLLVSLPSAIRLAVREYPQLQQVMNQKFGPLAQLRVRQAVNANNVAAVDLAAVQFEATEAAAEAHQWLGDRALSSGQFARAMAEYERALRTAPTSFKNDLLARMRLAAAMQGRDYGAPVTRSVAFGETNIPAAEFEAIVLDMKTANAAGGVQRPLTADEQRVYPALAPTGYEAPVRSRLDGPVGGDANAEITRDINVLKINWAERQIATLVEGNVLYVTNRFQVAGYNLDNGQRLWQTALPGGAMRAREWTSIPMRPLIVGNVLYARFLYNAGPTLAAFEKATGKLLWTSEQRQNEFLVSDPVFIQGQLLALTLVRGDQGQSSLRLTTFDRDSGEPVVQRNLARLNEVWWTRHAAEVTALDDALITTLGGVSLCCDASGNVRWIRRSTALPPDEETAWVRQVFERPLVIKGRAYLAQPGVRSLECVDAETGRIAWSHVLPEIETIVGALDERLIVRTTTSFIAYNLADGKQLWQQPRPALFDAVLLGNPGGLVYVERQPTRANKDRFWPNLVWVDPATGLPKSSFAITTLEDVDPHFGPFVAYKDRLFTFWGRNQADPNRDVVELVPKADAPPTAVNLVSHDPWSHQTDVVLRQPAERLFPGWALLAGGANVESGAKDDVFGEIDVLGLCVKPGAPTLFSREFTPAANTRPKLRMRFNFKTDQPMVVKLSVQFAGKTLWSQDFSKDQAPQVWRDLEVDLTSLAGQKGTLLVRADFTTATGGEMSTWWKRLEIVP
jgi:outer membrane protein assembly factor BamB